MATAKKKATERPYTVDEMAQIGNVLSAAEMPADVARRGKALSTPRLKFSQQLSGESLVFE